MKWPMTTSLLELVDEKTKRMPAMLCDVQNFDILLLGLKVELVFFFNNNRKKNENRKEGTRKNK